jgi:hypothetical protein
MDFAAMSLDDLWKLHETVEAILGEKIAAEILVLRGHLDRLSPEASAIRRGSRKPSKAVGAKRRPSSLAKIPQPDTAIRNVGGSGKAAALG